MIIVETFIICDKCNISYGLDNRFLNGKQHRKGYKTDGWKYIKGKDYCPKCK